MTKIKQTQQHVGGQNGTNTNDLQQTATSNRAKLCSYDQIPTPDQEKYILYADQLNLTTHNTLLAGPFDFATSSPPTRHATSHFIHQSHWEKLLRKCTALSIRLPTLSSSALSLHHWASYHNNHVTSTPPPTPLPDANPLPYFEY